MKRPEELRAAPREWVKLLRVAYAFLQSRGVGDLVLYGSQTMSVYMKNPFRSKDLDLLSSRVSLERMEALGRELAKMGAVEYRSTSAQTRDFEDRRMTTYAVELRVAKKPFFVELFDGILDGRPLSLLQPYVERNMCWNLEFWCPSREATVALRLAFREPEGISRLNAVRLNSFIKENRRALDLKLVRSILEDWGIRDWVERNLVELYRRNRFRILHDERIIPEIVRKIERTHAPSTSKSVAGPKAVGS